jgi:hypothetical protein
LRTNATIAKASPAKITHLILPEFEGTVDGESFSSILEPKLLALRFLFSRSERRKNLDTSDGCDSDDFSKLMLSED